MTEVYQPGPPRRPEPCGYCNQYLCQCVFHEECGQFAAPHLVHHCSARRVPLNHLLPYENWKVVDQPYETREAAGDDYWELTF